MAETERLLKKVLKPKARWCAGCRPRTTRCVSTILASGSATLHYLRALPVDIVKVDGLFVKDIATNPRDVAMVRSIGSMCRELNMQTVAEFVEDEKQVVLLNECKIQKGQGYLFGKPRPTPYAAKGTTGPIKQSSRTGQWVEWR